MKRPVILVGLPASGKTTVGRRTAELLSTAFTDLDEAIEAETGRSIAAIFAELGEAEFRRLERAAMDRALAAPPHLIAAGAGWMAQPGNFEAARAKDACVVYLSVAPEVAAQRLAGDASRPLLAGPDRTVRLQALLEAREPWYLQADARVDVEADAAVSTARVAEAIRRCVPGGGAAPS